MDYSRIYHEIINNALSQDRDKKQEYFESHHILPKCVGGTNTSTNLVLLTAREHFICHALLVKMYPLRSTARTKLLHAFMLMKGANYLQDRYVNSKIYNQFKLEYAQYMSEKNLGKVLTEDHKAKISKSMTGKTRSDEARAKISEKAKTRKRRPFTEEERKRISEATRLGKAKAKFV